MQNELMIRLGVFLALFFILACLESVFPKRKRVQPRKDRWVTNWTLVIIDALCLRVVAIVIPFVATLAAFDAALNNWGLMNLLILPTWLEILVSILFLDLAIWAQHFFTHKIPILWKLHRVHHADRDMDVSTAIRFHPFEIAISMGLKILLIYILGPAVLAVVLFEIILNGSSMFNHANLAIPKSADKFLRWFFVTPDMHRIHHSSIREEHDTNYGFALSFWDRIFKTYKSKPSGGHLKMKVGLEWQDDAPAKIWWTLLLPFRK